MFFGLVSSFVRHLIFGKRMGITRFFLLAAIGLFVLSGCLTLPSLPSIFERKPHHGSHVVKSGDTLYRIAKRYGWNLQALAKVNNIRAPYTIYANQVIRFAPAVHVVRRGETLYSIAWSYHLKSHDVAQWNRLPAPYTIYPKQRLKLFPPVTIRSRKSRKKPRVWTAKTKKNKHIKQVAVKGWRWPANGKILKNYSARQFGNKGLDISGKIGDPIKAAAAGKVVYSGNGLRGYGNLIIIKHNDTFLSAYAHNKKRLVKEGTWVKAGQMIAHMGNTGTNQTKLHFEIRRHGKPTNPLWYLPKS